MPTRPLTLLSLLLLAVMTGCPTFGPNGSIPMALHKDMVNRYQDCEMSDEDWGDLCGNDFWSKPRDEQSFCPLECQPPKKRGNM